MAKKPRHPIPTLQKSILQIRYKPKLDFYDRLFSAAQKLQKLNDYPHWETDRLSVTLKAPALHCSVRLAFDSITYHQDSSDQTLERERIERFLAVLPGALGLDLSVRFGFRRVYLIAVDVSFESLVSIMNVKMFSQEESLQRILPRSVKDLFYRVDSEDGEYEYHLTFAPVRKAEISKQIGFDQKNHLEETTRDVDYRKIVEGYPDVAVLVDIDLFKVRDEIPVGEAASFAESARNKLNEMSSNLAKYLLIPDNLEA